MILNSPYISGSLTVTGNIIASGSITLSGSVASASFASTASFVALAQSASNAVLAQTASSADNLLVRNTLTAQTLVVQTITSSVDFVTGSTRFGSIAANTHIFTGSMDVSGSITSNAISGNGSFYINNASLTNKNWTLVPNTSGSETDLIFFYTGTGAGTKLTLSSTGAATFAGSVMANGLATSINYKLGTTGAAFIAGTNNKGVFITDNASYASIVGLNSAISSYNPIELRASGTDYQLYLATNGFVGIGTNNPLSTLHISSSAAGGQNVRIQTSIAAGRNYIQFANNSGDMGYFGYGGADGKFFIVNQLNSDMLFYTNDASRMTISAGGNVLIGSGTTAQGPLDIFRSVSGGLGGHIILRNNGAAVGNEMAIMFEDGDTSTTRAAISSTTEGAPYFGDIKFKTGLGTYASLTTRMQLTGAGNLEFANGSITWGYENQGIKLSKSGVGPKISLWASNQYLYLGYAESNGWERVYAQATSGGVYLTNGATSWTGNSDERLKNIIGNIENATDKLSTLRTVKYSWKEDTLNREYLGLIAQDVQEVLPEIVDIDEKDEIGTLGVRYTEIIPVLVKAIQELKAQNDDLQSQINELKAQ